MIRPKTADYRPKTADQRLKSRGEMKGHCGFRIKHQMTKQTGRGRKRSTGETVKRQVKSD